MNRRNPFFGWRIKARLSHEQVEKQIHWPKGLLFRIEKNRFESIPCFQMVRLAKTYQVTDEELFNEIQACCR